MMCIIGFYVLHGSIFDLKNQNSRVSDVHSIRNNSDLARAAFLDIIIEIEDLSLNFKIYFTIVFY